MPSSINLLDFSPAAAFSLRSFDSSADPTVVNVRRSTGGTQDFKASEITDGTLATWVGSGNDGFVTEWYDQSGNNVTATQATASDQPKIVSSGAVVLENSKPAIDMNTGLASDRLDVSQTFRASNINNFSLFTVQKASGTNSAYGIKLGGAPDGRSYLPRNGSGTNFFSYGDNLVAISLGSAPTDSQLVSAIAGATQGNAQAFVNGSSQGSVALQSAAQGGNPKFGAGPTTGTMQEVVMFHNDQSANRTIIEGDINTYYSIY